MQAALSEGAAATTTNAVANAVAASTPSIKSAISKSTATSTASSFLRWLWKFLVSIFHKHKHFMVQTVLYIASAYLSLRYLFFPLINKFASLSSGSNAHLSSLTKSVRPQLIEQLARQRGKFNTATNKPSFHLSEHEMVIAQCLVDVNDVKQNQQGGFDRVGGHEQIKKSIIEAIVYPFKYPELYQDPQSLRKPPKGMLLYGPPGTGKTLLAQAIASECDCTFINVQREVLSQFFHGESEKLVAALFSLAEKLAPTIIFIDEIESVLYSRSKKVYSREVNQNQFSLFLSLWDGFVSNTQSNVIVVGATNLPEDIDAAAMRRMPLRFHVALPTCEERAQILKVLLQHDVISDTFDYVKVAKMTEGFSGADLRETCKRALSYPAHEYIELKKDTSSNAAAAATKPRPITEEDFAKAIKISNTRIKQSNNAASFMKSNKSADLDLD